MNWNGRGRKWSWPVWSTTATYAWRNREKLTKICQASWWHGQDSHRVLPCEPTPSVDLYNIIHHCYHSSLQVHILRASKGHHMHISIYLHSPSSSKVHLCWCKCSVKTQMMDLILQWRPNVTTLVTAVLSLLKCLYKIGQSSSYHPATICVSVVVQYHS